MLLNSSKLHYFIKLCHVLLTCMNRHWTGLNKLRTVLKFSFILTLMEDPLFPINWLLPVNLTWLLLMNTILRTPVFSVNVLHAWRKKKHTYEMKVLHCVSKNQLPIWQSCTSKSTLCTPGRIVSLLNVPVLYGNSGSVLLCVTC